MTNESEWREEFRAYFYTKMSDEKLEDFLRTNRALWLESLRLSHAGNRTYEIDAPSFQRLAEDAEVILARRKSSQKG